MTYRIDAERHLVCVTMSGAFSQTDLRDIAARVGADPAFQSSMALILDLSDAVADGLSSEDVGELARNQPFVEGGRRAVVATNPAMYGVARMFETRRGFREDLPAVRVFRTMADAEAWLSAWRRR